LIGTRLLGNARVAGINFFPPSSDASSDFWDSTTDGDVILANALEWAGGCDGVDVDDGGVPDACDRPVDPGGAGIDRGGEDGVTDGADNCPLVANANLADSDDDGVGDVCEDDQDGDGVTDDEDNCPITANANQADSDGDGIGDACDSAGEGGGGQGGSGEG